MAIDRSSLTDPRQAVNLVFKKENTADVYQKNNVFHVRALTDSYSMSDEESESMLDRIFGGSPMKKYFVGRIIGANSPHSFLPNPCDDLMKQDDEDARRLVSLHTTFLLGGDIADEEVSIGQFYEVVLKGGEDDAPFNLQFGIATRKLSKGQETEAEEECDSLEDLFDGASIAGGGGGGSSYAGIAIGKGETTFDIDDVANCEDQSKLVIMHPLKNASIWVSSPFGPRAAIRSPNVNIGPHFHGGVDFAAGAGQIFAVYDGVVTVSGKHGGAGNYVKIQHTIKKGTESEGQYFHSAYMHMKKKPLVTIGQQVKQGQQIGLIGTTGASTGPHLHFEIRGPTGPLGQPDAPAAGETYKDGWGNTNPAHNFPNDPVPFMGLSKSCKELQEDPESAVRPPPPHAQVFNESEQKEWDDNHEGLSPGKKPGVVGRSWDAAAGAMGKLFGS